MPINDEHVHRDKKIFDGEGKEYNKDGKEVNEANLHEK